MTQHRKQQVSSEKFRRVFELLQAESTLVLATQNADGALHSTPLFYLAAENLDLMWLSSANSTHSESIRAETNVSVAVFRPTFDWQKITGVQMQGACSIMEGAERSPILDAYCAKFHLGNVLSFAVARSTVYRFTPRWVRYIDNRKRFGYKFELVL